MRKVIEYFGQTATYSTDIQLMIMKATRKVLKILVKVATGDKEIDKCFSGRNCRSEYIAPASCWKTWSKLIMP